MTTFTTDTPLRRAHVEPAAFNQIALAHGGGGQLTDVLLNSTVLPRLDNTILSDLLDAGVIGQRIGALALTIDSYVVEPLFFPGGDIGRLAICGTVNDLAVSGARPLGVALAMILCEGLPRAVLERVLDSIRAAAAEAEVHVVTGDTKVIERGDAAGIYLTTAGVGRIPPGRRLHPEHVQPGDVLIVNGPIGEHGLAVILAREMPEVKSVLRSDAAPLAGLVSLLLRRVPEVVFMRDPTRGGLAGVAADLAARCGWHVALEESHIPIRPEARHAAEMLGLDPLDIANEGKVLVVVRPRDEAAALEALRAHPLGRAACVIGRVEDNRDGRCELYTTIGGRRIVQKPYGEQLPRIC